MFAYEYLAYLGIGKRKAETVKQGVNCAEPEWTALLAVNPDEVEDLSECRRPTRAESTQRDRHLAFLGIDPVQQDSEQLVQRAFNLVAEVEPLSMKEARNRWDWPAWFEATIKERDMLKTMKCYDVVDLPKGAKLIKSRIVYKLKLDREGKPLRYKARIVAKGFQQRWGIDYVDSFSATAHPTAIRMMMALAAQNGWFTNSTDITNAFISADIDHVVYVQPPEGLEEENGQVWKLNKFLYGLATSSRGFNKMLVKCMKDFGFQCTTADECCFSYKGENGSQLHVMVVVDDMIQVGNDPELLARFIRHLRQTFTVTDDKEVSWFLGVAYDRDLNTGDIHATQTAYLERSLEKFAINSMAESKVPMTSAPTLDDLDEHPTEEITHLYRSMIGTLMYLAIWTRPDIALCVNILARYMNKASPALITAAKQVFRYLKGTKYEGITFFKKDPLRARIPKTQVGKLRAEMFTDGLYAFSDSSDADDPVKKRSTGGFIVFYNGSPVSWSSGLQRLTTLSTCESEYIQAALTCKEVLYLREMLEFAFFKQDSPTVIYEDNEAAMRLSENPINRGMTKHIARRFHFLRQSSDDFHVTLIPIESAKNVADAFTKPLPKPSFQGHRYSMGMRNVEKLIQDKVEEIMLVCLSSKLNHFRPTPKSLCFTMWEPQATFSDVTRCRQLLSRSF